MKRRYTGRQTDRSKEEKNGIEDDNGEHSFLWTSNGADRESVGAPGGRACSANGGRSLRTWAALCDRRRGNDAVEALEKNEIYLRDVLVNQAATIEQLQAQMAQMEATHKAEVGRLLAMFEKLLEDRKSQAPPPNALKLVNRFNAKDMVPVKIHRFGQGDGDRKQITLPKEVAALLKDARGPKFRFSKRPRKVKQRTAGTLDAGGQQGTGRR